MLISERRLRQFCAEVFVAAGVKPEAAEFASAALVDANARGVASHGVVRLRIYVERLLAGLLDPEAEPKVVTSGHGGHALVEAENALGVLGMGYATEVATDLASRHGLGTVGIRHSNHCGALGFFTRRTAQQGWISIAMSNAPVTMTYFGGRARAVGTNPLSIAIPRRDNAPIVFDIATSATARGKIILAATQDRQLPEGWAIDSEGRPTTDPHAALEGCVLPFAGPKGSGLAMMIDLLCGVLTGADFGRRIGSMYDDWDRPQNVGHLFLAVAPGLWSDPDTFFDNVEAFVGEVKQTPAAAGHDEVLLPGELEEGKSAMAREHGIELDQEVIDDIEALARSAGAATGSLT